MANSGVNVKMGVSGIQQFKQSINVAKNSVKTLDAQLALAEKEFKQTGDAEAYMATKSDALKAKLSEQKTIISQAEQALEKMKSDGVTPASKAFQDMKQQLLSAKGALIDTETALDNISGAASDVDENVSGIQGSLKSINQKLSFQNVTDSIGTITHSLEQAALKAIELGGRLVRATLGGGAWADELATEAKNWGISPEELQQMQMTAKIIDTDAETILQAKAKMNKGLGGGSDSIAQALEDLGLGTVVSTDPDENFWAIGEAIMNMGDAMTQEDAAQKIFGKSWRELIPLFEAGREEYEKTNASWNVVSKEQLESLTKMDDEYQKLQNELEVLQHQFEATFAEVLTPVMETLTGLLAEFNEYLKTDEGKEMLKSLQTAVSGLFSDLSKIDPEDVINNLKSVFDNIKTSLEWITNNKDSVVDAMKAIVVGWGALKLTGGALKILELVNGVKGLTNGGGGAVTTGGTSTAAVAGGTGLKASLTGLLGAGSSFSMMGGAATFGPLAAMAAAGYAGWKMVEANGNDPTLQKIYGYGRGSEGVSGGLFDTMTPQLAAAVARYWELYQDTGSEEAMEARENLYKLLEEGGFGEHPELATQLIEQAFDNKLNEHDIDGLVAKLDQMLELASGGNNGAKMGLLTSGNMTKQEAAELGAIIGREVNSAIERLGIYMDGHKVGQITAPYVGDELAGMVYEFTQ